MFLAAETPPFFWCTARNRPSLSAQASHNAGQLSGEPSSSAFEPLKDEEVLKNMSVFHGVITWMDGKIDIAPETVYQESYPYDSLKSAM